MFEYRVSKACSRPAGLIITLLLLHTIIFLSYSVCCFVVVAFGVNMMLVDFF